MFRILLKNDGTQVLQQSYDMWEEIEGQLIGAIGWKDVPMFTEKQAEDERQEFIETCRNNILNSRAV